VADQKRRHFTGKQKVEILREHLIERKALSEVCEKHDIQPSLFYYWQKQLFEKGDVSFERDDDSERRVLERKVDALEARLAKKDAVIAEVTEEMVKLKKELGEP
jgi:transposase-like protein